MCLSDPGEKSTLSLLDKGFGSVVIATNGCQRLSRLSSPRNASTMTAASR